MDIVKRFVLDDIIKRIKEHGNDVAFRFTNEDLSMFIPYLHENYNTINSNYQIVRFSDDCCIHVLLDPVTRKEYWIGVEYHTWEDTIFYILANHQSISTDLYLDDYKRIIQMYLSMFHVFNMTWLLINHHIIKDVFDYIQCAYKRHVF